MAHQKRGQRPKHVPQRTCIACRQTGGKRGLVRIVRTESGVVADPTGKLPGRGAYLHPNRDCWSIALDGNRIQQALRTKLSAEDKRLLLEYRDALPAEAQNDAQAPAVEEESATENVAPDPNISHPSTYGRRGASDEK